MAQETARFIELVDAFFDCMNVGNYTDGKRHRKVFQQPFRTPSDFRFKVKYTTVWAKCIYSIKFIYIQVQCTFTFLCI